MSYFENIAWNIWKTFWYLKNIDFKIYEANKKHSQKNACARVSFKKDKDPRLFLGAPFLQNTSGWLHLHLYSEKVQQANIGPQDVPKTSPSNIPRTSPEDPIWPSRGHPDLTSWRRPNLTSWNDVQGTS